MDDALTLNNWSNISTPNMNLALMGIPVNDTRTLPGYSETGSITTTRITKVVRTTEGILVKTRNTWYKLGTIDPAYLALRVLQGLGKTDPADALIDWAQDPKCEAEFEDRAS